MMLLFLQLVIFPWLSMPANSLGKDRRRWESNQETLKGKQALLLPKR